MTPIEQQTLRELERLRGFKVAESCTYKFKNLLRLELVALGLGEQSAQEVVCALPVNMPDTGLSDAWLTAAAGHYAYLMMNLLAAYKADNWPAPVAALVAAAKASTFSVG